jgi:phosphatidate cytidylyltransferase
MIKYRFITALVLAPLVIGGVLFLPSPWFTSLWGLIIVVAAWEWAGISGLRGWIGRGAFLLALGLPMVLARYWAPYAIDWLMYPVLAWWILVGLVLRAKPQRLVAVQPPLALKLFLGWFILLAAWILFIWLWRNFGAAQALYLLVLISFADIAAYFIGQRWGFTKLLPEISPGKTVEGLYGALAVAALVALAAALWFRLEPMQIGDFVVLSLVTVVISVCGDLFESLLKRQQGVKDSGSLLPGHGGVLDRIDSLLAGVAVFYTGSMLLGLFLEAGEPVVIQQPAEVPATVTPGDPPSGGPEPTDSAPAPDE